MTSLFPFSSLSVPHPISVTFQLHLTSSTCLLPPLLQLQGVLMQLCYICTQTSLRLTSDLLGPDPHAKGYHLYTSYNLSDPFFIINNRLLPSCLTPFSTLPIHYIEPDLSRMRRQLSSHFYSGKVPPCIYFDLYIIPLLIRHSAGTHSP